MHNHHKIIYLSVLIIANLLLYLTPLSKSAEVKNFDLSIFDRKTKFGEWQLAKDIGPTSIEIENLPNSIIIRKVYSNKTGEEVQMVLVSSSLRTSIHTPTDCLPAQGWVIDFKKVVCFNLASDTVPVNTILSHLNHDKGIGTTLVWYWFATYDGNYCSHFEAVVHNALQRIIFGRKYHWALIRLSTTVGAEGEAKASFRLLDFLQNFYPTIKKTKESINTAVTADQLVKSAPKRHPIPIESDTPFRCKATDHSD